MTGLAGNAGVLPKVEPQGEASRAPVVADEGSPPASFTQQRLWFVDQLVPGSPAYNMPSAFRLTGPIDPAILERCFREAVRRHEALRTTFATEGGHLVQAVHPDMSPTLPVVDLSHLPAAEREAEARRWIVEDARRPFDLERGPLLRIGLLRLGTEDHILTFVVHHIACDGWGQSLLYPELATLYTAFARGEPAPPMEAPPSHIEFAARQRREMQGEELRRQLEYWKPRLDGLSPTLELPTDRPRPAESAFRGAHLIVPLPASLVEEVRAFGRREGTTPFMTLLAAFQALLQRYSGQLDVAVGTPIAGRPRRELHRLVGCLINMIVLRTDLSGDPTFRALLQRVRAVALGAYSHQDLPFDRLVEEIQPIRDPSRQPLFQVLFDLFKAPTWGPGFPGVEIAPLDVDNGTSKYDLTLTMIETPGGLSCDLEYDTDLFDAATASRMLGHFQTLLEAVVADPEKRLSELPLLTDAERRQILSDWNDTRRDYPRDRCVHDLFRDQAARTPGAVAVVDADGSMTYAELDAASDRLARRLCARGVGPGALVGLCVSRSTAMVSALLGILKAGGAYVPLDPALPKGRLALMLDDSRASVLVTETALRDVLPDSEAPIVLLDSGEGEPEPGDAERPGGEATAGDLAYVIYTSGSTGKPKGVQVSHRALTNFLVSMRSTFEMTGSDALLAITTLSFDIAGLELYLPLIQGARVELAGRDEALDGMRLARRLADSGATFLQGTPATWRLLLDSGWRGTLGLSMLCGGEALPRDLADRLLDKGTALWNLYGPTETTIWSSVLRVEPGAGPLTIGRPIANTQLYVLDGQLRPVPIGVLGELFIGGDGLARGYLGRPGLSSERFLPDPFGAEPGARLYRTGDRARYRGDGEIEFLGRFDDQVKIRGFRIEPGEVESALRRHPAVRQAAVVVLDDEPGGDRRLVAYLVPHPGPLPTGRSLREFLRERLPSYMVPSAFALLDNLPLNFSGKVDRRALPDPRQAPAPPEEDEDSSLPRTPVEVAIAEVFRDILGADRVLLHDSFIDLGGHSLQSVEAIARLEGRLGLRLTPRELLLQTVGQLASTCERQLARPRPDRPAGFVRGVFRVIRNAVLPGSNRRNVVPSPPLGERP